MLIPCDLAKLASCNVNLLASFTSAGTLGTPSVMMMTEFGAKGLSPFLGVNITVLMYLIAAGVFVV